MSMYLKSLLKRNFDNPTTVQVSDLKTIRLSALEAMSSISLFKREFLLIFSDLNLKSRMCLRSLLKRNFVTPTTVQKCRISRLSDYQNFLYISIAIRASYQTVWLRTLPWWKSISSFYSRSIKKKLLCWHYSNDDFKVSIPYSFNLNF